MHEANQRPAPTGAPRPIDDGVTRLLEGGERGVHILNFDGEVMQVSFE